ncbi:MAG: hypothetical protein WC321_00490 [Candidatus Omnitrophota bacterium]|jgi:hypothetical protein
MSIIYDALKKVEGKIKNYGSPAREEKEVKKAKAGPKIYLVYLLIIAFGAFSANLIYRLFTPSFKTTPAAKGVKIPKAREPVELPEEKTGPAPEFPQKPIAPPEAASKEISSGSEPLPSNLILNGIFFSENDAYALINNQIVKEGEEIEGLVVAKIGVSDVELKNKETSLKLSIGSR